jgi:hypothetical protein
MRATLKHMFGDLRPGCRNPATFVAVLFFALAASLPAAVPAYVFYPSAKEVDLYLRIRSDAAQQRVQVVLDPRLCKAARKHAEDTQRRKFFAHKNPDGVNSNQRVINEGYPLPSNYDPAQNYVESLAGSVVDTAADAVNLWRNSPAHAAHVFGKDEFYRAQVVLGVGQAPPTRLGYATYVFISAPGPVGQTWSATPRAISGAKLLVDSSGIVTLTALQPQTILEVWNSPTLQTWTLRQTLVVGPGGTADIGGDTVNREFFRMGYFQPWQPDASLDRRHAKLASHGLGY